jgi:hypothetical protein
MDRFSCPPDFKIISGGQTGADTAALDWAIARGVQHGGWCPKGRRSEDGVIDARHALKETPSSGYLQRTEWNVRDSDATIIFTTDDRLEGVSKRTAEIADRLGKPWLHFRPGVHPKFIARFLEVHNVKTLNVAGKRASASSDIGGAVTYALNAALDVPGSNDASKSTSTAENPRARGR